MVVILDKIKVVVRIRPLKHSNYDISTKVDKNYISVKDKMFSFDNVFDVYSKQESIFEASVKPLIESFLMGINISVLAYGQTGSGKTHTMGTHNFDFCQGKNDFGIIPRVLEYIFSVDIVNRSEPDCSIQFLELYNEEVRDLFQQKGRNSMIRLVDGKNGVIVSGLSSRNVRTVDEAMMSLREGGRARTTAATAMNAESSRSHAIFTVSLTQSRLNENGVREVISSKFNFVDLAGSERLNRTGAVGTRAKEGININFGLLALGNVINALSESASDPVGKLKRHIPYRDSKLTRLLEDSLGGSSKCLMIACVCPSLINVSETLNTINYAARVKNIENRITVNHRTTLGSKDNSDTCVKLQQRIAELERELQHAKATPKDSKFVNDANNILKIQSEANETVYKDTIENMDSLCYLLSLEHDTQLMDCFPNQLTKTNRTLSFEKSVLQQKIKTLKNHAKSFYFDNNIPTLLLDHFEDKLEESTKTNSLKLNAAVINNAVSHKLLSKTNSHELRWKYLLNFISKQYILTDCVNKEVIKQYEGQLAKSYKLLESLLSHLSDEPDIVDDIICQIKQKRVTRSSISERHTPVLSMQNLQKKLGYLFPLVDDAVDGKILISSKVNAEHNRAGVSTFQTTETERRQEPMDTDESNNFYTQTKTFKRTITALQRKTSMKLSDQRFNILNEKQGFVKRNGLCLPIIKSPVKNSVTNIIKRSHTVLDNAPKRSFLTSVTNQANNITKFEEARKFFVKKPVTEINVMENFRKRNLTKR